MWSNVKTKHLIFVTIYINNVGNTGDYNNFTDYSEQKQKSVNLQNDCDKIRKRIPKKKKKKKPIRHATKKEEK